MPLDVLKNLKQKVFIFTYFYNKLQNLQFHYAKLKVCLSTPQDNDVWNNVKGLFRRDFNAKTFVIFCFQQCERD